MYNIIFLLPLVAIVAILSFLTAYNIRKFIIEYDLFPKKKDRDIHKLKVPSSLGIGFLIVFTVCTIFYQENFINIVNYVALIFTSFIIVALGFLDDLNALSSKKKLLFQLIAIGIFLYFNEYLIINNLNFFLGISEISIIPATIFTVFIGIVMINGLNLIDGIDGFAAIITIISSLCFALIFWGIGSRIPFLISILLAAILLGYLPINISNKKKGFMGDSGSMFIGYMFFILTLIFLQSDFTFLFNVVKTKSVLPLAPLSIYIIPILDTLSIYYYRFSIGKGPLSPDNFHLHHMMLYYINPSPFIVSLLAGAFIIIFCSVMSVVTFTFSAINAISTYFILLFFLMVVILYFKSKMRSELGNTNGNVQKIE